MIEYRSGGRRVRPETFFKNIQREALDLALQELEERARGAASSIVDPEMGKRAPVFVRRTGETSMVISTRGSPAFARALEKRLGVRGNAA
jgi:hypothetical protein